MANEVSKEIEDIFYEIINETDLEHLVNIEIRNDSKLDKLKLTKIKTTDKFYKNETGVDVYILVNEEIFDQLDTPQQLMIADECLAEIYWDYEKDKLCKAKPNVITYMGVLEKYGTESYINLVKLIEDTLKQMKEKKEENNTDSNGKEIKE